jgi:hypothetical protein
MVGPASSAGAATVHRRVVIIDVSGSWANSGHNVVVPNSSTGTTSPGGTTTSRGTATVRSGRATATGTRSFTAVFPFFRR